VIVIIKTNLVRTTRFSHICVPVSSQDLYLQYHMLWSFFVFSKLRWEREVIVRFVDIGGIDDHQSIFKLSFHTVLIFVYHTQVFFVQKITWQALGSIINKFLKAVHCIYLFYFVLSFISIYWTLVKTLDQVFDRYLYHIIHVHCTIRFNV
jgi:hypothetical protein